ncbi:NUDIX domain-containing protein [Streptomyces californicus]|uniref:NUDIX hydrolase n=1 Tax=Streptomyces californicus TaxID=67351 RepID=UPI0036897DD8
MTVREWQPPPVLLAVDLLILTLRASRLHMLVVERGEQPFQGRMALPGGFLQHADEEIVEAAHRELREETALGAEKVHLEQLGTYGTVGRDPRGRVVSVAHLAIAPELPTPQAGTDARDAAWIAVDDVLSGQLQLAFDHDRIVRDGIERARRRFEHSSLATAFCGDVFTMAELQQVYEAVWGISLDIRNFSRKIKAVSGFLLPAGRRTTAGRPALLYRAGQTRTLSPPFMRPAPNCEAEE